MDSFTSGFTGGYSNSSPSDFWFCTTLKGCDFNNRPDASGRKMKDKIRQH
jgi:hypothetical protein